MNGGVVDIMQGRDVILGILNLSSKTGYEINDVLKNQLSFFYDGTYGMIYPTLRKLESEGMIEKKQVIQDGKPNKNVYSITDTGKKEFKKYMDSDVVPESIKSDFLLRLYFGRDDLSNDQIVTLFSQEIERKQKQLSFIRENFEQWKEKGMQELQEITLEYGISYYENAIKFLKEKRNEFLK